MPTLTASTEERKTPPGQLRPSEWWAQQVDLETEVLGALLHAPTPPTDWLADLSPEDFTVPGHRRVFEAMLFCASQLDSWNVTHIVARLRVLDELDAGTVALGLAEGTFTTALLPHASWRLRLGTCRRSLQTTGAMILDGLADDDDPRAVAKILFLAQAMTNLRERIGDGEPC